MDYSLNNNNPMILPTPDQLTGSTTPVQAGTTGSTAGTTIPTGTKSVGGTTSGVDASKGALTATGVNSLIVDQEVPGNLSSNADLDMDVANIFKNMPAPPLRSPQDRMTSLSKLHDNILHIGKVQRDFASAVATLSALAHGAGGKGGAGRSSANSAESVSKSVSPTGATTTTTTSQSSSASGGTTTDTTTTTSSTTSSTESTPSSSNDEFSFTTILAEIAELTNQQSATLAQQQTSQIDAISQQAADSMSQAASLMTGATSMMTMAAIGLAASMGTMGMGLQGIGKASQEGDEAETQAITEQQQALSKSSETSLSDVKIATDPATSTKESIATAQRSLNQLKLSTKELSAKGTISKPQEESINNQVEASQKALDHAQYQAGGTKGNDDYASSKTFTDSEEDFKKNKTQEITTPDQAVAFYRERAEAASKTFQPATDLKDNITNFKPKLNRNSEAWQRAYSNSYNKTQLYAGAGTAISNLFSTSGQAINQMYQAQGDKLAAAAQTESATEQAMAQGTSQTNQIAGQLRDEMNNIASYMAQDASQKM